MCISHTGQCLEVIALFVLEYKISGGGAFVMGHTHSVYCGDETFLIVTFKPIDSRLIYCNDRSVESEELSNCVCVYARVRIFNVLSRVRLTEGAVCTVA